ncbi:MAG: cytochrome c peroxidase [Polyangiaceae bacterium]|nr:cytochrome c peroxidase [Polyangiaceae bacterium]
MIEAFSRKWLFRLLLAGFTVGACEEKPVGPLNDTNSTAGTGGAHTGGASAVGGTLGVAGAVGTGAMPSAQGGKAGQLAMAGAAGFSETSGGAGNATTGGAVAVTGGAAGTNSGGTAGGGGASAGAAGFVPRFISYGPSPYPVENPNSETKALLGKILFWDEQLGGDSTVACGTCHRPNAGGTDPRSAQVAAHLPGPDTLLDTADDVRGSLGVVRCDAQGVKTGLAVQVTGRKAPTYLDAMFSPQLFWDGRAECRSQGCPSFTAFEDPDNPGTFPITYGGALENQAVGPPMSPVEMACEGAAWPALHARLAGAEPLKLARQIPADLLQFILANDKSYPKLFAAAFGSQQTSGPTDEINTRRIAFAIATHERRLLSNQTAWDRWNAGDDAALTPAQVRGFELFHTKARCSLCHQPPTFADGAFHFIGFHKPAWDQGRYPFDTIASTPGAIRTPTLRNVGLREASGLTHSGAGPGISLEKLMELYNMGGLVNDPDIAGVPISPTILPLQLTPDEIADIIDFMRNGLTDPRVAAETAPFDRPLLSTE